MLSVILDTKPVFVLSYTAQKNLRIRCPRIKLHDSFFTTRQCESFSAHKFIQS